MPPQIFQGLSQISTNDFGIDGADDGDDNDHEDDNHDDDNNDIISAN